MNKVKSAPGAQVEKIAVVKNEAIDKKAIQLTKLKDAKELKESKILEIRNELAFKQVGDKFILPSKGHIKNLANVALLTVKELRTLNESKRLLNSLSKVEDKTANSLYKFVQNCFKGGEGAIFQSEIIALYGSKDVPNFKLFVEKLPAKFSFSKWDAFTVLEKMNPKYKLNKKIEAQNKATKAK